MIADSHCHLDYPNLYNELDDVVNRAIKNDVKLLLTICTTVESFKRIKLIVDKYKIFMVLLGFILTRQKILKI